MPAIGLKALRNADLFGQLKVWLFGEKLIFRHLAIIDQMLLLFFHRYAAVVGFLHDLTVIE
jgi:hypothetical protein